MSDQQPKIEFSHVNPTDNRAYFPDDLPVSVPESKEQVAPNVHVVVEQSRQGSFMRRAKIAGKIGVVGTVVVAGIQVKNWIGDIGNPLKAESTHSVDLTVEAPDTEVYEDVYLNLARVESTFGISLDTSLDRPGPINCDTQTRHTGEKGEDEKITTSTNLGIIVEELSVTRDGEEIIAEVSGGFTMTDAAVDYSSTMINVRGATGGLDACVGANEITKARNIVDVAIQQGAKVAASCAMQDEAGRDVFESGVKAFVANTDLVEGLRTSEVEGMNVVIEDYSISADAMYGNSVQEFRSAIDTVVQKYLEETDDHKDPKINDRDLMDCSAHDIEIADESSLR